MIIRRIALFAFITVFLVSMGQAGPGRFIVDDDDYLERIAAECSRLLWKGKLKSAEDLGAQVKTRGAADTDADTCFVKIDAHGLKPLGLRTDVRAGERVYCLSHPGGYHYMFTGGMVARLNTRRDEALDEHGKTNGTLTRPILFLNVTA